jgi:hypothetical protein
MTKQILRTVFKMRSTITISNNPWIAGSDIPLVEVERIQGNVALSTQRKSVLKIFGL